MEFKKEEEWIKTAKLAVAVAIVRSKPESMNVRDYTIQLSENYRQRNKNEHELKIQRLQKEIDLLRRQLDTVCALTKDNNDPPDFPTPPEAANSTGYQITGDKYAGDLHSSFLTKLSSLKRLVECDKKPRISAVVRDTLLDFMPRFLRLMEPKLDPSMSTTIAQDSIRTLVSVLEKDLLLDNDLAAVENAVSQFVVQLWLPVLQDDDFDQPDLDKRFIRSLIIRLGMCDKLKKVIVITSMKLLENYCEHLRRLNDPLKVNIVHQENIVHVIDALEEILYNSEHLDSEFLTAWKCTIEMCVLHLAKDYPMLCSAFGFLAGVISSKLMPLDNAGVAKASTS